MTKAFPIRIASRLLAADGYMDIKMFDEARKELDSIPVEYRDVPDYLWLRHRLTFAEQNWSEALDVGRKLCALAPDEPESWVSYAYAARELQQVELARRVADKGVEMFPDQPLLAYNLACYECLLGNLDRTRDLLTRAFSLDGKLRQEAMADTDLTGLWYTRY
ncbi:MAG: hypothetical protein JXR37_21865 [Kiritimatiellae bacterium]|nr:hypothetical protein [Kiritimatiellia bacterium]